jgi:branched-chain amino acid transport system ATP-binding protein
VLCLVRGETLIVGTPNEVQSDPRVIEAYIGTGIDDDDDDDQDSDGHGGATNAQNEQDTP